MRAAWWLELRSEALTHMQNVGCDALIGYREECAIYEDVCVLSVYATSVKLNQMWIHATAIPQQASARLSTPSTSSASKEGSTSGGVSAFQATREHGAEVSEDNLNVPNLDGDAKFSPLNCVRPQLSFVMRENFECGPITHETVHHARQTPFIRGNCHYPYFRADCSIFHIPSINQALPSNKYMRCRVCLTASVPEFLISSTEFPPELPVMGSPSFIQVG
ncbi:unnamed protein product [Mesocestoides corti]|uniref:C2 domain-containing protein n=1 Tax=Mesocestoides corti TaxID=53468 RepID=A0A3P6H5W5_MESCO|nr:unnamed protein product [Mesocestoides corti]